MRFLDSNSFALLRPFASDSIKCATQIHALPEPKILGIAPSGAPLDCAAGYPKLSRPRSRFCARKIVGLSPGDRF